MHACHFSNLAYGSFLSLSACIIIQSAGIFSPMLYSYFSSIHQTCAMHVTYTMNEPGNLSSISTGVSPAIKSKRITNSNATVPVSSNVSCNYRRGIKLAYITVAPFERSCVTVPVQRSKMHAGLLEVPFNDEVIR